MTIIITQSDINIAIILSTIGTVIFIISAWYDFTYGYQSRRRI